MDYSEIAPYDDAHFAENIDKLASEPGFEHAVRWVLPDVDFPTFIKTLKSCTGKRDFQTRIMQGFLEQLERNTTSGITSSGIEHVDRKSVV